MQSHFFFQIPPKAKLKTTTDALQSAIASVKAGNSVKYAAEYYGVARTTLTRKLKLDQATIISRGREKSMTEEEEAKIIKWIVTCAERGTPRTVTQVRQSIKNILNSPNLARKNHFKGNCPSRKWTGALLKRHRDHIRLHKPEALSKASAAIRGEDLVGWWSNMDNYFDVNGLKEVLQDASRIFNADESFFEFNPAPKKVIVPAGGQSYVAQTSGNKTGATILHTVSLF